MHFLIPSTSGGKAPFLAVARATNSIACLLLESAEAVFFGQIKYNGLLPEGTAESSGPDAPQSNATPRS
jgi:hypothetical protein